MTLEQALRKYACRLPCTPEERAEYDAALKGQLPALEACVAYQQEQRAARNRERLGVVYTTGEKAVGWLKSLFTAEAPGVAPVEVPGLSQDYMRAMMEGRVPPAGSA